jgi:hypothetical protein
MAGNFLGFQLPFGTAQRSNPTPAPGFPSTTQLQQQNAQDPNNPQNAAAKAASEGTGEPVTDPNNNADPTKGTQGSSLDEFKDLFKLPTDDKGNVISHTNPLSEPLLKVDPAQLQAAAKKMNFAAGINPEAVQKALSGDVSSFMEVLNSVAQNGFTAAMQANAGVVETAFTKNNQRYDQALPARIRETQINQAQTKHPALSHPAAAPMVAALKSSIAQTNPHLPPDRVAEMAERYVIAMATDINSTNQQQTNQQPSSKQETDWAAMLGT